MKSKFFVFFPFQLSSLSSLSVSFVGKCAEIFVGDYFDFETNVSFSSRSRPNSVR